MANTVDITVRMKDQFSKQSTGLKSKTEGLKSAFKTMAATGAAFGALQIFKNSIKGASDLNESISKTNVVFGKNAGEIHKWAQSAATSMGLSRQAAEEYAGSLGLIFTQMGATTSEASKMSRKWTQLAVDIGSFNNADPTEVLDSMESATRGEYDALQKYVPSISAAAVEQEALRISGKKTADQLSAHDRLLAIQKILWRDTAKAQGDFSRTSHGAANRSKILKAQLADLGTNLGEKLLPPLSQAAGWLQKFLDFGEKHSSWVEPLAGALVVLAGSLKAVAIAQGLANTAALANPYIRLAAIILAVGTAFVIAYKKSQGFRNFMLNLAANTAQLFIRMGEAIVNAVLSAFNLVVQGAAKAFGWIPGVGKKIKQSAKDIQDWKNSVVGSFDKASDSVENWSTRLKNAPKVAKLKGDIRDLQSKLSAARSDLKRTSGTKAQVKVTANINSLLNQLDRARAALNRLNGFTADTYIRVHQAMIPTAGGLVRRASGRYAAGGITGAQSGGPRTGRVLVGEHGPEFADLPAGSRVHSNSDTRRMMQSDGFDGHLVLEFKGSPSGTLDKLIWDWIKANVRAKGGKGAGSVQKALGY